jgi:hypothetical protein
MLRSVARSIVVAAFLTLIAGCSSTRSDQAITTDIQSRMFSDPQTKSANISVTADQGNVTLAGQVPDNATRDEVFKVAQQTPGVKNVYDRMAVQQAAVASVPEPERSSTKAPSHAKAAEPRLTRRQKEQASRHESARRQQAQAVVPPPPPQPAQNQAPPALQAPEPVTVSAPAPPPPQEPRRVEIPSGTPVRVQLVDPVDTSVNHAGDVFHASLAAPIVVDSEVVVPTGTDVFVKLMDASSAGRIKGKSTIQLQLARMEYQGTSYTLASDDYNQAGKSRGTRSAETIGGGAAIGAIIGAIAGGGKGAAIGAGVGGAGGTVAQAATHGEQIRLPAETKLDFTLQEPVTIRYFPYKNNQRR